MTIEPQSHLATRNSSHGKIGCQEIGEKTGSSGPLDAPRNRFNRDAPCRD
jgi:hypothetical protein